MARAVTKIIFIVAIVVLSLVDIALLRILYLKLYPPSMCWDGRNLDSPNGRVHTRSSGILDDHCPVGWYRIPSFREKLKPKGDQP